MHGTRNVVVGTTTRREIAGSDGWVIDNSQRLVRDDAYIII
jgi:hypothetical protein